MLQLICSGTPYEIGLCHGRGAKPEVARSIQFYADLFLKNNKLEWVQVREVAGHFGKMIEEKWPAYYAEMQGVAEGAEVLVDDIVALNVRTEINFGMFSDGCTALSWHTENASYLAQNWDWMPAQKQNLVAMTIEQTGKPAIKMVTEAGIIGKIGFNSAGVGVCLNAIRAFGVDRSKLPCHLGLRMVLESESVERAEQALSLSGIASACHMLIADECSSIGVECSSIDIQILRPNTSGQIFHTNHYLLEHQGVHDTNWLKDSPARLSRVEQLSKSLSQDPDMSDIQSLLEDEEGLPTAICRQSTNPTDSETVFHITMELRKRTATVRLGNTRRPDEEFQMSF